MASILETLTRQMGGDTLRQISGMLGADEQKTENATGAALSALVGALSRNASRPEGAEALAQAVERDHDGSLLDDLSGFLGQAQQGPGDGILRHVLGGKRENVETGISRSTGLDKDAVSKLLVTLAPMVLGALGKMKRQQGLDASGLASQLGQERRQLEQAQPAAMGMLGRLLDTDHDGDLDLSDLAKHGSGLLGKLFRK
jgi:hypothetical protein